MAMLGRWRLHLLGLFVLFHVTAVTLKALPTPEAGMNREAWQNPTVQTEFRTWEVRLHGWGFHFTHQQFEDFLWSLAGRYLDIRGKVLSPFDPYYRYCGTYQSWQMFVAPDRFPARLYIDVFENGDWRPVFVERSSEHTWLSSELSDTRFRSVIFRLAWPGFHGQYEAFADWVAKRAAKDFPSASRVRLRFYHSRTPSPEEVRNHAAEEGGFDPALERELGRFR
jgi:hypothetical protein